MIINGRKHILVDKEGIISSLSHVKEASDIATIKTRIDNILNNLKQCM